MNREDISAVIGGLDERHVAEAFSFDPARCGRSSERIINMKKKRIITFALAAALILALGVGAYAGIYSGRVQDLVLKTETQAPAPEENEIVLTDEDEIVIVGGFDGEVTVEEPVYDPLPGDVDMISLQGFAGSPEYQAALAWAEFEESYDTDGAILDAVGNAPTPWDDKYAPAYFVYSQEMADTIDAIAAEYGLALHSGFRDADMAALYARFGRFGKISDGYGYCYDDGSFQFDGDFNGVGYQLRRSMKGVLDTVFLNVTDAASYEQWEYKTACGKTVLLALGPHKALILSESEQSFTAVNVLAGTDVGFSVEELEAMADAFDFSLL